MSQSLSPALLDELKALSKDAPEQISEGIAAASTHGTGRCIAQGLQVNAQKPT